MMMETKETKWTEYEIIVKESNGGGRTIMNYRGTIEELRQEAHNDYCSREIDDDDMRQLYEEWMEDRVDDLEFVEAVYSHDCRSVSIRRVMSESEILEWLQLHGEVFKELSTVQLAKLTGDLIREDLIEENETAFDIIRTNALVFSDDEEFPIDVKDYIEDSADYIELFDHIIWNRG